MNDIYTYENWLLFLKSYFPNCKNQTECHIEIGKLLDLEPSSVKNSVSPSKELPKWAKAFVFAFINAQNIERDSIVKDVISRIENAIMPLQNTPCRRLGNQK